MFTAVVQGAHGYLLTCNKVRWMWLISTSTSNSVRHLGLSTVNLWICMGEKPVICVTTICTAAKVVIFCAISDYAVWNGLLNGGLSTISQWGFLSWVS